MLRLYNIHPSLEAGITAHNIEHVTFNDDFSLPPIAVSPRIDQAPIFTDKLNEVLRNQRDILKSLAVVNTRLSKVEEWINKQDTTSVKGRIVAAKLPDSYEANDASKPAQPGPSKDSTDNASVRLTFATVKDVETYGKQLFDV